MDTPRVHLRPLLRAASLLGIAVALLVASVSAVYADESLEARRSPIVRAVAKVQDAVVSIHTKRVIRRNLYNWIELPPIEGKGIGSGTIFHPEGYVITNAHVIARASEVLVDVADGKGGTRTHPARILAVDLPNDLAILRLLPVEGAEADTPTTYPYLPLGRSDDLMLGETVVALGNPFGIGFTVTSGIVGGLGRTLRAPPAGRDPTGRPLVRADTSEEQAFNDFIQIDAAINPGNSGGLLMDVTGRWIGVNTAIWNRRGTAAEGIGFAIPVERVRSLIGRAFKRRLLRGDWLGVEFEESEQGVAVVRYAFPKGPGRQSGLREGDRVVSMNGTSTPTLFDLRWHMSFLPHGAAVRLGVVRDTKLVDQAMTVRLLPVPTQTLAEEHLGFVAEDVSDEENRERELEFDAGVVVRAVRADGPSSRIGLKPGDVIVGLGSYRIRHTDDLLLFLQYVSPEDVVKVRVLRAVPLRGGRVVREEQEGTLVAQ